MTLIKDPSFSLEYTAGMVVFREEVLINGEYYDSNIKECKWRIYSHTIDATAAWAPSIHVNEHEILPDFNTEQEAIEYIKQHINEIC